jgi:hypothetical protein
MLAHQGILDIPSTSLGRSYINQRSHPGRPAPVTRQGCSSSSARFFAVLKNKVHAPDKAKVVEYLSSSFGLTPEEAEEVVQAVGTAP